MYLNGYIFLTSDISILIENEMVMDHHNKILKVYATSHLPIICWHGFKHVDSFIQLL